MILPAGYRGTPPPGTGMGTSHPEAEALTYLHFFEAMLKMDALAGKVHFFNVVCDLDL